MQITLTHQEIKAALTEFVKNQGFPTKNHKITVDFEKSGKAVDRQYRAIITIDPPEPTQINQEELAISEPTGVSFT